VVVFHSAVAAYLSVEDRLRMRALLLGLVRDGACHWVSNESPTVFPRPGEEAPPAMFRLDVDGEPVGWAAGHGQRLVWA
jgi:hypothetical protein